MKKRIKQTLMGVLALAALAGGGAALAGAATSSTSTSSATSTPAPRGSGGGPPGGFSAADAPGTAAHENAEKAVTGEAAEKAQAAALATVSGGKAGAVTSDFRGSGYEVTVTKTDGTQSTVHLDSSFKVQTHPSGGPSAGQPAPGAYSGQAPPSGQPPQAG
ncbi:MAG TPA: hypothetical protein VGN13_07475 [Solirubrobacteraceae bacterium]|jgi:hypothetical protein